MMDGGVVRMQLLVRPRACVVVESARPEFCTCLLAEVVPSAKVHDWRSMDGLAMSNEVYAATLEISIDV